MDEIENIKYSYLIKDFKIVEEKITDINYSANFSVNFNSVAILEFFEELKIQSKVIVSEEYLVFPLFKDLIHSIYGKMITDWYESLVDEYDELGLLKLYFPEKNHINKIKISAKNLVDEDINSIEKFLSFYNKKKAIIIFLKEDFDLNSNELRSSVFAKKIDNNEFTNIKLFENQIYEESSEISNAKLISKIIIDELEIWWKNQIDIFDSQITTKIHFLKLDAFDLRKNIDVENKIRKVLGSKDQFYLHEFDQKNIIYKFQTSYDINQLNLALEIDNLKLLKNSDDYYYLNHSNEARIYLRFNFKFKNNEFYVTEKNAFLHIKLYKVGQIGAISASSFMDQKKCGKTLIIKYMD